MHEQELDQQIKDLNSSRVIKKVTPGKGDLSWYIKWTSCAIILVAVMCRSAPDVPKIYDLVLSCFGCLGWLTVGWLWHDRALIVLNGVLVVVLGSGIMNFIFK